jgi:site-specific DNA-cytosine methylase
MTKKLNVLVACEYSGRVRDAFIANGHNAISVDLLETENPGPHFQGDIFEFISQFPPNHFDLLIAHPPCTYLAVSGARHLHTEEGRWEKMFDALEFVKKLLALPVNKIALENPVSLISTWVRKADQTIQPWQHGTGETKATCLWLENLPKLVPSNIVEGREPKVWREPPGPNRSRTYLGVAKAMADQWGGGDCRS